MARQTSQGECAFCKGVFGKGGMKRHLGSCSDRAKVLALPPKSKRAKSGKLLHLVVEGECLPMYWLHIEFPAQATLQQLDQFLRDIWLECCGHLSAFDFGGQRYSSYPIEEYGEQDMKTEVGALFTEGIKARHEYDFGSTTELIIKYADKREGVFAGLNPVVMARNLPPEVKCEVCGKPATQFCTECMWDGQGELCDEHAEEHECGEEVMLPVVNSPRMGVCGYTGQLNY